MSMVEIQNKGKSELPFRIEILSTKLLDGQRPIVEKLKRLARSLGLEFGWHYLLDLTWIISNLGDVRGMQIMDAGAGTGLMQWYLAQEGAQVISVDRLDRAALPLRFRMRYHVQGLRPQDLIPSRQVFINSFRNNRNSRSAAKFSIQARDLMLALVSGAPLQRGVGSVAFYHQDLGNLVDIPDNSLDAVVAVSALEHNTPQGLEMVVAELMRVLRPGGRLLASLCAARDEDIWHAPSSGWCYTDHSLRRLFCLPVETPSNYDQYDRLLTDLRNCAELRDNLARFYFQSENNGMPLGKWDPQYQPVGVCKIKPQI